MFCTFLLANVVRAFGIFKKGQTAVKLQNPSNTCVVPFIFSPKYTFKISKFFLKFPVYCKINKHSLFCNVCHFLSLLKSQTERHTLILIRYYSTTTRVTGLFWVGTNPAFCSLFSPSHRSSCLQQQCHLSVSSQTVCLWKRTTNNVMIQHFMHIEARSYFCYILKFQPH
jgi:hypothetical protein